MTKRFRIAMLGIILGVLAVAAPATAEAAVQASIAVTSQSNPCSAGSCRVTVRDQSLNPSNEAYTVQFDCDDTGHIGSFVSDSGAGRPPRSQFTCFYPTEGEFLLQMRTTSSGGSSIAGRVVQVTSRANAPAPLVYSGPSTFPSLPGTFEILTPKRNVHVGGVVGGGRSGGQAVQPTPVSSRFDGSRWHHQFRLWVAPVRKFGLDVTAWNEDPNQVDYKVITIRVLKSPPFPKKGFRIRVPCIRTTKAIQCTQRMRYYAAKRHSVRFSAKFQVKVRGRWRTFAHGKYRPSGYVGRYFELKDQKTYRPKLKRRYRHKPIRARFAYRVIHRQSGPDKTVYFKRTRYKRIRISP